MTGGTGDAAEMLARLMPDGEFSDATSELGNLVAVARRDQGGAPLLPAAVLLPLRRAALLGVAVQLRPARPHDADRDRARPAAICARSSARRPSTSLRRGARCCSRRSIATSRPAGNGPRPPRKRGGTGRATSPPSRPWRAPASPCGRTGSNAMSPRVASGSRSPGASHRRSATRWTEIDRRQPEATQAGSATTREEDRRIRGRSSAQA